MAANVRYAVSRGKLGSPVVFDTEDKRPVLVCLRAVGADEKSASQAADDAAVAMANTCAQALNRVAAEQAWKRQQEKKP